MGRHLIQKVAGLLPAWHVLDSRQRSPRLLFIWSNHNFSAYRQYVMPKLAYIHSDLAHLQSAFDPILPMEHYSVHLTSRPLHSRITLFQEALPSILPFHTRPYNF